MPDEQQAVDYWKQTANDLQEDSEDLTEKLALAHETGQQLRQAIRKLADEREEEVTELRRQKDALCEELENIATADWAGFDDDRRRAPYEFAMWAQSRARHTLNRVLSGDVTKPLPEDAQLYRSCEESRAKWEAKNPLEKVGVGRTVPEPNCDRSVCGDWSPGGCDHPDCPALGNKLPKQEGMTIKEDPQFREELRKMMAEQRGKSVPVPHA